jgi:hypothetical protein
MGEDLGPELINISLIPGIISQLLGPPKPTGRAVALLHVI